MSAAKTGRRINVKLISNLQIHCHQARWRPGWHSRFLPLNLRQEVDMRANLIITAWTHWRDHFTIREAWACVPANGLMKHHTDTVESYKLAAMKLVTPSKEHLEKHYEDLADKPFYKGLVTCMPWTLRPTKPADTFHRHAEWAHLRYGLGGT